MRTVVAEIKNGDLHIAGNVITAAMAGKIFDIDSIGNMAALDIEERPIGIPGDAYYYSLSFDLKDEARVHGPSRSTGSVTAGGDTRVPYGQNLEFNLFQSIGLNWAADWTILYFKTPQATHTENLIGYDIESLGCNANSVGGGYLWWGKTVGADALHRTTPAVIDPLKYFGSRHAIVLIKSGDTLTIRHRYINGKEHVRTIPLSTQVANYFENQYGYDLRLGGWDGQWASNAKYRDLIVVKRAINPEELKQLTQVFWSCDGNTLRVQGNIIEGAVL